MAVQGQQVISGNLPTDTNIGDNKTTRYFNNYFTQQFSTSPNVNDAVIGYFETVTGSKESAINLAASVLYTAQSQGVKPMEIIDQFRNLGPQELNAYLAMFLNINRVSTSLLGISTGAQPNQYVQRAILL